MYFIKPFLDLESAILVFQELDNMSANQPIQDKDKSSWIFKWWSDKSRILR